MDAKYELMIRQSKDAMNMLAPFPEFPDFAFGLFEDGWATHHRVTRKSKMKTPAGIIPYASYETFEPSQTGKFSEEYVSRIFNVLDKHFGFVKEIAAIPYTEERVREVLSLGDCIGSIEMPGGFDYKMIKFDARTVKMFYPPRVIQEGEPRKIQ